MVKSIVFLSAIIFFTKSTAVAQQYDWNKASQKQREKDNQAYIDARIPEKKKSTSNSSGSNSGNYYDNLAAADRKKREDAMNAERKKKEHAEAEKAQQAKREKYRASIIYVAAIPANYSTRVNLAIDAGYTKQEALNLNSDLNPYGKLVYNPNDRYITYETGPAKTYTAEEIAVAKKNIEISRIKDSLNKINEAVEKNKQKLLKMKLDDAMLAYSQKDYMKAALLFDSSLTWKDLDQSFYNNYVITAGKTYRKLGEFEKSIQLLLKHKFWGYRIEDDHARGNLIYQASISAFYSGDFNKAIALGNKYNQRELSVSTDEFALQHAKAIERGTTLYARQFGTYPNYLSLKDAKLGNTILNSSYHEFLSKTADPKQQLTILPHYVDSTSDWSARLIRTYYSFKTGDSKYVKEQTKLFAKANPSVKFEGDIITKLANMLYYESKRMSTYDDIPVQALYMLDLAIDLLPGNTAFLQTRYQLNTLLKRIKFAEADAVLLGLK